MASRSTRFLGIALASSVSVTALQAGIERSLGPVSWATNDSGGTPPVANASFQIVLEPGDLSVIAPHAQWFRVTNISGFAPAAPAGTGEVHDPQAHDITWIWSFGDPGSAPNPACNLPNAWRDTNTAYGKRVAHVFANPGTFTVTCWAFDNSGNYGTATVNVTVADPAVTFAGNRTICVNPAGDSSFAGAPAGAQQVQGIPAAMTAMEGLGQTCRILLKRGATFADAAFNWPWNTRNVYVGAYGSGAAPLLRPPAGNDDPILFARGGADVDGNKLIDLDMQGFWDVETETGHYNPLVGAVFFNANSFLLHNCRLRDFDGLVTGGPEGHRVNTVISNSRIENWRGFAIFLQGGEIANTRFAVIGSALHMSPNALQGVLDGYFIGQLGNSNGPFRCGHCTQVFWSCSSLFSNTGWSSANMSGRSPLGRPSTAQQSPIRGQSDQAGNYNASVPILWNLERLVLEGGIGLLALTNAGNSYPGNYILDKLILLGNAHLSNEHLYPTGGTTIRNVFMWMPNVPATHDASTWFISVSAGSNQAGNATRPVRIYNCTAYSARTSANANYSNGGQLNFTQLTGGSGTQFSNLIVENNIIHCPAQNAPLVASAPVQMVAIPGLTTLYRGPRWNFPTLSQTLAANVPNGGTITFAYPNDTGQHPNGRATNQAYFLTPPGQNRHLLSGVGGIAPALRSARGQFSVTFGASNITVTNTSGVTWTAGQTAHLLLDRRNDIGPNLAVYASPATVEVPQPLAGSPAIAAATAGLVPIDDLFARRRLAPQTRGALEVNV